MCPAFRLGRGANRRQRGVVIGPRPCAYSTAKLALNPDLFDSEARAREQGEIWVYPGVRPFAGPALSLIPMKADDGRKRWTEAMDRSDGQKSRGEALPPAPALLPGGHPDHHPISGSCCPIGLLCWTGRHNRAVPATGWCCRPGLGTVRLASMLLSTQSQFRFAFSS